MPNSSSRGIAPSNSGRIPLGLYKKIRAHIPVVCVDLVITCGKRVLLARRINDPEKGKWFFPGGRVRKDERLASAAKRILLDEVGLRATKITYLDLYEYFSKRGYFPGTTAHNIIAVFRVVVRSGSSVELDAQNDGYAWFDSVASNLHPYIKEYMKKVGIKKAI